MSFVWNLGNNHADSHEIENGLKLFRTIVESHLPPPLAGKREQFLAAIKQAEDAYHLLASVVCRQQRHFEIERVRKRLADMEAEDAKVEAALRTPSSLQFKPCDGTYVWDPLTTKCSPLPE